MKRSNIEAFIGFLVIATCCCFSLYVYQIRDSRIGDRKFYHISGVFSNIEGIQVGSDVKIGGIKVGHVLQQKIDQSNYSIKVTIAIMNEFKIPKDSWLVISTSGILGKTFLEIRPGHAADLMSEDDNFELTESAINLGDLITKFAFNRKSEG